ncbi:MAG TPA: hypothetical protein VGE72_25025 [Azospirillum sp.]
MPPNDLSNERLQYLDALRRAEAIVEGLARAACENAVSGRPADLEAARMALEAHRKARELREDAETQLMPALWWLALFRWTLGLGLAAFRIGLTISVAFPLRQCFSRSGGR